VSLDYIRNKLKEGLLDFGPHLVERMIQHHIDLDQVIDVIQNGILNKKESDDRSKGRFTKYTLSKGSITVVIKDSDIPFVITTFRRK